MLSRIKIGNVVKHLLLIFSGLIVMMWTVYLMFSPWRFVLGFVLFLITFTIGELLLGRNRGKFIPKYLSASHESHHFSSGDFIAIALAISSILIALIPPIEGKIWVAWSDLPSLNTVRLVAAFSLNFLPGYLILSIIGAKTKLKGTSRLLASYFLSLFIITIVGFLSAHVHGIIDGFYLVMLLLVNVILIVLYFSLRLLKRVSQTSLNVSFSLRNCKFLLPAVLLGLIIAFKYVWLIGLMKRSGFFIGGPGGDVWMDHGFAQSFLDGRVFAWLHLPWWFHMYLASFAVISGAPSLNAYAALYPLMILSVLSFYVMASGFSRDRRVTSLATLAYVAFSGPSWLYALNLRGFGPITDHSSWISILWKAGGSFYYEGWYPPFTIGFVPSDIAYAGLWFMVYATLRLDLRKGSNFILLSIVSAITYLFHGVDMVIFVIYLGALLITYLFTRNEEGKGRVRWASFSLLASLALVAVTEVSLTGYYYFSGYAQIRYDFPRYYYFNSGVFYALLGSLVVILMLTRAKPSAPKVISTLTRWIRNPIIFVVFFLYIFSLVIWILKLPPFYGRLPSFDQVEWYSYSAVGGVPFLLALIGATYLALSWKKLKNNVRDPLVFSVLSLTLLFIFGKVVSFINVNFFYTAFWERRILVYMHPIISILAAYIVVKVLGRVHVRERFGWLKFAVASFLISIIILSSVSTTLIAFDFTTRFPETGKPSLTTEELEALTYLHYSLPLGLKTAYVNKYTGTNYIRAFANDKWAYTPKFWIGQFIYSPQTILDMIAAGNFSLLYLHHTRDTAALEKNLFIQQLIEVLPVEFNNSAVTIYSIPPLRPPSASSPLCIVSSNENYDASNDAYTLWLFTSAVSDKPYTILDFPNPTINSSQILISPYDPLPNEGYITKLLDWVANGGHLLVPSTNFYGTFSELLGLTSTVSLINGDSLDNWRTFYKRGEILLETSSKIEGTSSLRMRNNLSSWEEWKYNVTAATAGSNWDLSGYEYLGFWIKGTGGPQFYLHLTDSNDTKAAYRYDTHRWDSIEKAYIPKFTGWKLLFIPIEEHFGHLNLSDIKELKVVTGFQMPVDILIDNIFVMPKRDVFIANGIEGKGSTNLPSISVHSISAGSGARIIANYTMNSVSVTPFAVEKSFGSGKITYLNIKPIYDLIVSGASERASHEILIDILKIIDFEAPP